ncbi:conserved hypothetical protein [Nitrosococcus halophilus Nc 4]|uniref:Sel1 repeat family protein n=1 Tax=Nitrosococcus halophilus (strain Nc4) TaxID=472759 RepID=D5BXQ8_NITHN|nr:hypothetical protein [Nitrosococcus halophilus]ADE14016.1 conserved hypothetical protein [Nitrosococcus halophilus Nc 4]
MNLQEFKNRLAANNPPQDIPLPLQALWYEAKGDWDQAHHLAQSAGDAAGAWVHAYLHRKEGDLSNAAYWYSRAGKTVSQLPLKAEWEEITQALLQQQS